MIGVSIISMVVATPPASPCISVQADPLDGAELGTLQQAVTIAVRKRSASCEPRWGVRCQPAAVRLDADGVLWSGNHSYADLKAFEPWERAAVVADAVVDACAAPVSLPPVRSPVSEPATISSRPDAVRTWRIGGTLEGEYSLASNPAAHRGGAGVLIHVGLLDRRLLVGARATYFPPQQFEQDEFGIDLTSADFGSYVAWAWVLGHVHLRLDLSIGAVWRRVVVTVPTRTRDVTQESFRPEVRLGIGLDIPIGAHFAFVTTAGLRTILFADGYEWNGRTVLEGQTVAGTFMLGIRWWE